MMTKLKIVTNAVILVFLGILQSGCNGLETDISKKLDFPFNILGTGSTFVSTFGIVDIPSHDEIDDYVDYAVYPNPFKLNEVSYQISTVQPGNLSESVDLLVYYRNSSLDTISLFQVEGIPVISGERTNVSVSQTDLSTLSDLVNTQNSFDLIIDVSSDIPPIDFILDIYFDTTIAIDYDEI